MKAIPVFLATVFYLLPFETVIAQELDHTIETKVAIPAETPVARAVRDLIVIPDGDFSKIASAAQNVVQTLKDNSQDLKLMSKMPADEVASMLGMDPTKNALYLGTVLQAIQREVKAQNLKKGKWENASIPDSLKKQIYSPPSEGFSKPITPSPINETKSASRLDIQKQAGDSNRASGPMGAPGMSLATPPSFGAKESSAAQNDSRREPILVASPYGASTSTSVSQSAPEIEGEDDSPPFRLRKRTEPNDESAENNKDSTIFSLVGRLCSSDVRDRVTLCIGVEPRAKSGMRLSSSFLDDIR